jgi:hypothetical protein
MLRNPVANPYRWIVLPFLGAGVLLALGCTPAPVVNVSPSALDARITVVDHEPNPSDGKVVITVQFFSNGQFVQPAGAVVTANGTSLPFNGGIGYVDRVPMVAAGGTYTIVHAAGGTSTTIAAVTAPQRPVITTPSAGAVLSRGSTNIAYVAGTGTHVSGQARGTRAGSGSVSATANDQPDDGSYGPITTTVFDAGAGTLSLTRVLVSSPAGSGFNSVQVTYNVGNRVAVTWQ